MTPQHLPLKPTAAPTAWMGWMRDDPDPKRPQPLTELVRDGLVRFEEKTGTAANWVLCNPECVEALTAFPGVHVEGRGFIYSKGLFYLGRSAS